jgi:hypothetical protein
MPDGRQPRATPDRVPEARRAVQLLIRNETKVQDAMVLLLVTCRTVHAAATGTPLVLPLHETALLAPPRTATWP